MENVLINYISDKRLKPYLELANNDYQEAIKLYEKNLKYSSYLYIILSKFEVVIRNTINEILKQENGNEWILNIFSIHNNFISILTQSKNFRNLQDNLTIIENRKFFDAQEKMIINARLNLLLDNKDINNDYLISRLEFGFWTNFFSKKYETIFWNKYLYKMFNKTISRGKINSQIDEIRKLRNRIAYNECIINRKHTVLEYHDLILNFLDLIDNKITDWIKGSMSRDLFNQ